VGNPQGTALAESTSEGHAMKTGDTKVKQIEDLLYQALETEMGGVQIYTLAIQCAKNDDLKKEWKE
jgi:rubrerythrin